MTLFEFNFSLNAHKQYVFVFPLDEISLYFVLG